MPRDKPAVPLAAYSIRQFCEAHGISVQFYYRLRRKIPPQTPREMKVGRRYLISLEDAAEWRARMRP
jgi:hypothetical protein